MFVPHRRCSKHSNANDPSRYSGRAYGTYDAVRMEAIIRYSKPCRSHRCWMEFHGTEDSVAEQAKMVRRLQALTGNFSWATRPSQTVAGVTTLTMHEATRQCGGLGDRVCVPISQLTACITETQNDLASSFLKAGILGHAGDGRPHVGFYLANDRRRSPTQRLNERLIAH